MARPPSMADEPETDWSSGLFDCFEDANACCYGFWCCPCMACTVSERFGENSCLPLCDCCTGALFTFCLVPVFAPPAVLSMRAAMRNRYNIKGSLCNDIPASCFCSWCSWCQMYRELKERKKPPPTVININNQVVYNMQPVYSAQPVPTMMMVGNPAPVLYSNQPAVLALPDIK